MKKISILMSALLITLFVLGMAISCTSSTDPATSSDPSESSQSKEPVLLRLAIAFPAGDEMCVHLEDELIANFNERAGGEYEIKLYPAETLIKVAEGLDAVRTGAVEMTLTAPGNFVGIEPRFGHLPFIYNNIEAVAAATPDLLELYGGIFEEQFNQKVVSCFTTGEMELISTKPVKTLDDWNGLLVGAIDSDSAKLATLLGGAPVNIPWTEGYASLEKGVVDAEFQGTVFWTIGKLTDVASYGTFCSPLPTIQVISINLDLWNEMPQNIQDIFLEETAISMQQRNEHFIQQREQDIEDLTAVGMDLYMLPAEERANWKAMTEKYVSEKLADFGEFGQKMQEIVDNANAEHPAD